MILRRLRRLGIALFALAAAAAAAAAVFLARPELLLTDRTVAAALKHAGSAYSPRWSSLAFSAASAGRLRHRYALRAEDFCADDPKGLFKGCFKRLDITAVVRFTRRGPRLDILESLTALGDRVEVDLRRRASSGAVAARLPLVGDLRVDLPNVIVRSADLEAAGGVFGAVTPGKRRPVAVEADLMTRGSRGLGRLKAGFTADTDLFNGGVPSFIDALGHAEIGGRGRARFALRALRGGARYDLSGSAEVVASTGPLRTARLSNCRGSASTRPGPPSSSSGALSCRYELVPSKPPDARLIDLKSASGGVRLSGDLKGESFSAVLAANIDPVAAWYELSGRAEARLEGRIGRPLESMALSHEAHATLKVARFEDLVAFLRDTKFAVPAPVHVLKGPLSLSVESRGNPRTDRQSVHYALTTDLAGPRQRLIARATGRLTVARPRRPDRAFEHNADVLLKEVALELPKLEIGPPPKVALDRRISPGDVQRAPAAAKEPSRPEPALRSRVAVRTEKPVVLFSNMAKEPVPVALDLVATYPPAAVGGVVAVRKFDVELFRRSATIDHLNVALSSGSTVGALEGLVLYKTPSVEIRILILGTTERPRVELTSVPPLKREDIIALLIFGKNPAELDPDQSASVSNTETALESRAFGLASLYLFGATPIEHVGYDSATKTTSVKLRLPGGAHLTLGSDFDQSRQLSVRKPLTSHWAIQSEITEQGQQSKSATTFLEWLNRY